MAPIYCRCGREAIVRTSWTSKNPGRRFYSCPIKASQCGGFLCWVEPDNVIAGLLRSKNELEGSITELQGSISELEAVNEVLVDKLKAKEDESRKRKKYLVLSWVFFCGCVCC
ncbi:hypothetical protein M8C21_018572 [Ambrosia artemisiifolia]|uniref:GRF-type domain-containing protein n=1 Tax=Ambrosia artemisiifolia TaxID=4212 RepID=A0AAD5CTB2_AMBAR|nr:hypothetical protein M8C21_018572 [Ambrosia artemisiifolia]